MELRMQTSKSTAAAYAVNQGIAAIVNNNTDAIFVEAQTILGTKTNIDALQRDKTEMVHVQNRLLTDIRESSHSAISISR